MNLTEKFSLAKHEALKNILKIKKLHVFSMIYLSSLAYLFSHNTTWANNLYIATPLAIFSASLVACGYKICRNTINKAFSNEIVKWVFTVFIYSCCLWYAKWKINIDYGITPDNINYAAISYALILFIPVAFLVCSIISYVYIYLKGISFEKLFISSFLSFLIGYTLSNQLHLKRDIEIFLALALIIFFPYSMASLIPFFKEKWSFSSFLDSISLLSASIALFIVCIICFEGTSKAQKYLLFLDASASSSCNLSTIDGFYLRKNDNQCYKVVFDNSKKIQLILINSKK